MPYPSKWPDWMDDIWAKSAEKGEDGKPETLATHTWYVMQRLSEFIHLRPTLPDEIGVPRLWHILFWAAFLHDFGKAAHGFQNRLRGGEPWWQRHEVLSLSFVDWVAADLSEEEQTWLVAAIVSHHKDASIIDDRYPQPDLEFDDDLEDDQMTELLAELDEKTLNSLWRWLNECPASWCEALQLNDLGIELLALRPQAEAVSGVHTQQGVKRVYHWLKTYRRFVKRLTNSQDSALIIGTLTMRGYLINADHSASSHMGQLPTVAIEQQTILESRKISWDNLYEHQKQAAEATGNVLLTAPTGSGKTEAALLWAAQQITERGKTPRLFYTLPYQASMNAMWLRLRSTFGQDELSQKELVGLQHGRVTMAHYRMLLDETDDDDANPKRIVQQAKQAKNLAELNYPPVRIFSPYQMLKGPYRLRGYEKLLTDYHHALFIFDEIHAYEVTRLALILKTIEYLRQHFQARFLIMSATFPTIIKDWLSETLDSPIEIEASPTLFKQFQRHRLRLLSGDLVENLDKIESDAQQGKSVLVVCNLVDRAQRVYQILQDRLTQQGIEAVLLHGRFNMRDRSAKEKIVREAAGRDESKRKPLILIATQVVEVSLDIDLNTIYTDPAPLEALVQRFGRINRHRPKGSTALADVHVFREADERQEKIYQPILTERTLQILERENGNSINEGAIGEWLDEVYEGEVAEQWIEQYQQETEEFAEVCLEELKAFESSRNLAQRFYEAFDGTEVLPRCLLAEYEALKKTNPLEAYELLVPIRYGRVHQLRSVSRISDDLGEWPLVADVPYSSELGLDFSQAKNSPETVTVTV